ncbi:hypothetical protein SKAU_G00398160 [Synaphobranchus kaupii]|uniref:RNA-binding protein 48 n=1 Tax=Synaphobranchus kaupii TaxID=118154 RepID=A0A9Q1E8N1_SYNKA|nr:hypothetical protein SKAU_G00398160 [Synaphobranchus kaupii]
MAASDDSSSWNTLEVHKHHEQRTVCHTRPKYREGRRPKAVKVYTINLESRFLLVQGVPAIGLMAELVQLFALYGAIEEYRVLDEYPAEEFTEVYLIKFQKLQSARVAKRNLDERSFYGGLLHVCYAPENETVEDTRQKLQERKRFVARIMRNKARERDQTEVEKSKMPNGPEMAMCEKKEWKVTSQKEEESLSTSYFLSYPLLPPPPQEDVYRPSSFSEQTSPSSSSSSVLKGYQCKMQPAEDNMGSTYHFVDTGNEPLPSKVLKSPSHGNPAIINKQRKICHPTTRFIPRTTQLENRKRKMEEVCQDTLLGIADTSETLIGPRLPQQPKMDMEDASLNITANLIRNTMAKISSVPECKPAEKKATTPKPRRRI